MAIGFRRAACAAVACCFVLLSPPALAQKTAADYGVDISPRITTLKVVEPAKRSAGIKVADVDELVTKLKAMGVAK